MYYHNMYDNAYVHLYLSNNMIYEHDEDDMDCMVHVDCVESRLNCRLLSNITDPTINNTVAIVATDTPMNVDLALLDLTSLNIYTN